MNAERLDQFTDAVFAFAITLLLIGGSNSIGSVDDLVDAMAEVPAFMVGFASLLIFWTAHVRYRNLTEGVSARGVLLTLALIFLVLIYVQPLRAMAQALALYIGASDDPFPGDIGVLFSIYGGGFSLMSLVMAGLLRDGADRPLSVDPDARRKLVGEMWIWLILAATGIASFLLTLFPWPAPFFAPWLYATLPVVIGIFSWRYPWEEPEPVSEEESGDVEAA